MEYIVDIFIGLPLLYLEYKGAVNGIVKEILNIVGLVLAVYITFNYMDTAATYVAALFEDGAQSFIPFLAGALLFIIVLSLVSLIAYWTREWLDAVKLGTVNRFLGSLFGILKGSVFISAILLLLVGFQVPREELRKQSILYPYVIQAAPASFNIITAAYPGAENFTDTISKTLENYNPVDKLPVINP
jgi:membrane protein required for colicin V production